ncbi:MAG: hypothetical protein LBS84_04295 [Clostridiales bacterium]|nr:hypothetical protein [Clostridiales bacterium]
MFGKKLYIFMGADVWRCLLTDGKRRIRELSFTADPEEILRGFLRGVYVKKASVVLSSECVIARFARLPQMKGRELKKASAFLYEGNFPVDKDKYVFGYRIVGRLLDKYSLVLAALPIDAANGVTDFFDKMGIRIEKLWLFEDTGGMLLSDFISILVFVRQETTWRVIWMKNKVPLDIWRISTPADINALFAELDYGETIDDGLFYSKPEDWIVSACEEYGLAISEALDPLDLFEGHAESFNMLPSDYKRALAVRRALIISAAILILLAVSAFAGSARLNAQTAEMLPRNAELTARIRSLNETAGGSLAELPAELEAQPYEYGSILKYLTDRLPPGAFALRVSAADGFITLTVSANGGEWLNEYIDDCRSGLGVSIRTSRIAQGNDVTEIDLQIEVIR